MSTKYPDLQSYIDAHYRPEAKMPVFQEAAVQSFMMPSPSTAQPQPRPSASYGTGKNEAFLGAGVFGLFKKNASAKRTIDEEEELCAFERTVAKPCAEKIEEAKGCVEKLAEEEPCAEKLEEAESYDALLEELKEKLDERQQHLADSFSDYLLHLIAMKNMNNVDVYKGAAVDKKLFAKIKNDPDYHPQKLTCLCLCVGAKCNYDEAKDLLSRAGYTFSPSDMRDVIFQYFIEKQIYDIVEIDLQLEEYGVPGIIA